VLDPPDDDCTDDDEAERESLDPRNMLVWVPTKSLAPDWAAAFLNLSAKRLHHPVAELTELQVKIGTVRPIDEGTD